MNNKRIGELRNTLLPSPDILGREEYANSAVLVPVVLINGEEHLLFERRAPHIKQGSEICFPGGHFDRKVDSSFVDTALRETYEELGIVSEAIRVIGQLDTLITPRGVIVESYLAFVELGDVADIQVDRSEVDDVFTVPLSWFLDNPPEIFHYRVDVQPSYIDESGEERILLPVDELGLPSRYKVKGEGWKHRVIVYRRTPDLIWGITAAIVYNMIEKVSLS